VSAFDYEANPISPALRCDGPRRPGPCGYRLRHDIAALKRVNAVPMAIEIEPEPEDERHWVRQQPPSAGQKQS
jgi:hypothetical protein